MTNKNIVSEQVVNVNGNEVTATRIYNDTSGNPRYVVHFLDLNIKTDDYGKIKGLTKYNAKWYGGGYVFQSYNIADDLIWAFNKVDEYYNN